MLKDKLKPHVGLKSIILIAVAAVCITLDLVTKHLEEEQLWNAVIISGFIEIGSNIRNPGCAFSFLNDHPEVGQPLLITLTFILLAVLIFAFIFLPERFLILKISISIVAAGALGNLVDRLAFRSVRDWFGLNMFGNMTYCNFADFIIVVGAILAVIDLLFLNEWAVFPLTKSAKAAQAARKAAEDKRAAEQSAGVIAESEAEAGLPQKNAAGNVDGAQGEAENGEEKDGADDSSDKDGFDKDSDNGKDGCNG